MSLETLIEAARYVEMQDLQMKKQSTSPPMMVQSSAVTAPTPITIRIKQEKQQVIAENVTTSVAGPTIQLQQSVVTQQQLQQQQQQVVPHRVIRNSFDIINPLVIDEGGEAKRKQPPMVFRSGTREVHNKLEKHRRAHLKECFDLLKRQLSPTPDEKKTSNLSILHSAIKCIQDLKQKEKEYEIEMEQLACEKIALQQRFANLKKDVSFHCNVDFMLPEITTDGNVIQLQDTGIIIKEECDDVKMMNGIKGELVSINNELKLTKSITKALPVAVATTNSNGIKEGILPQTTQVQTTALSVLPIGYQMNQSLVLQKVIVNKGLTDLSQLVASSQPVAHFIATPQQLGGKVMPLVNTQYVVKPLVVVSTPSRPS